MSGSDSGGDRPVTGGPPRSRTLPQGADIDAQINALEMRTTADLRAEWQRLYRAKPPTRMSRDLLLRGVTYKVQEQAYGGLSLGIMRKLRSLTVPPGGIVPAAAALRPGTKLAREWHGRVHTVDVLEGGFAYQGEHYRSLSRIARQITGAHRSGPLFFGIGKRARGEYPDG